jgi:hypothetical protein
MRQAMDDQRREEAPSGAAEAWDKVRRLREPLAWAVLVLTAIGLLIGVLELFGLNAPTVSVAPVGGPGSPAPPGSGSSAMAPFGVRAFVAAPAFVDISIIVLPVLAIILVAFAGGLTNRAREVVQTAVAIQAVALGLGVVAWLATAGDHLAPNIWFVTYLRDLGVVAAALIFAIAVWRSAALRLPRLEVDYSAEDEDFGDEDDSGEDDEDFDDEEFGEEEEIRL